MILENNSNALRYVPLRVKQRIDAENLHKNYFEMACSRAIPSADNTLKSITICSNFFKYFASMYYTDKVDVFIFLSREYIKPSANDIDNT